MRNARLAHAILCAALVIAAAAQPAVVTKADRVIVLKSERSLILMNKSKVIKSYKIALGGNPVGATAAAQPGSEGTGASADGASRRRSQQMRFSPARAGALSVRTAWPAASRISRTACGAARGRESAAKCTRSPLRGYAQRERLGQDSEGTALAKPNPFTLSVGPHGRSRRAARIRTRT